MKKQHGIKLNVINKRILIKTSNKSILLNDALYWVSFILFMFLIGYTKHIS